MTNNLYLYLSLDILNVFPPVLFTAKYLEAVTKFENWYWACFFQICLFCEVYNIHIPNESYGAQVNHIAARSW